MERARDSVAAMPLAPPSPFSMLRSAYRAAAEIAALHGIFLLTGLGMVVLGPILPAISLRWQLGDRSSGLLLGGQFLGSFVGAITLGPNLRKNLSAGCAAIVLGFGCVAAAAGASGGYSAGVCGFVIAGFGLGRTITSINLIAGARFTRRRAAGLSLLNLTWGLGALAGPVAVEHIAERYGLTGLFAMLTALNAIVMVCGLLVLRRCLVHEPAAAIRTPMQGEQPAKGWQIACFAIAFCAYGGIEASLSGWTSSLTARSSGGTLQLGATVTTSLWAGMAAGRAVAALLLLRAAERRLLTGALAVSGVFAAVLLLPGTGGGALALVALGLGASLAPVFPLLCSLLMAKGFAAGDAGRAMAATALGGAIFPWLVGVVSQKTGTLQHGLWIPVALCVLLAAFVPTFFFTQFGYRSRV